LQHKVLEEIAGTKSVPSTICQPSGNQTVNSENDENRCDAAADLQYFVLTVISGFFHDGES
jgi:hypothetical protein